MPLSGDEWERVQELFNEVVDLPPQERAALLKRATEGNETLRREVESLLASDERADSFIEDPISAIPRHLLTEAEESEDLMGRQFGAYRVIREIGRGGLGAVYLGARADEQFEKLVAIKIVKRGLDTDDILRRFRAERQILAQLEHPHIARLIDAGSTDDGLPYFVMEYVDGQPIHHYCEAHRLSTKECLDLFRLVCGAVTYAHQHLVIHRDIKPSNILVTTEGVPKLLDFGIAKFLHADDPLAALTMTGVRAMTPEYASPEQVRGLPISTSTDIYSLGVLLYELVTGQKPYRLTTHTPEELSQAVVEQTPERPSTAITRTESRSESALRNSKSLKGDLDNIVLMALRKEPERRYSSVAQFSDDIRRHLEGRPVIAHKDTFQYRATKFVRRNSIAMAVAALLLLTLLGGIVATAWQAQRATAEARVASAARERAEREGAKAQSINAFLQNILGLSDPTLMQANPRGDAHQMTVADAIEEAAKRAETELADQPEVLAAVQFSIGRIYAFRGRVERAEALLRSSLDIRRRVLGSDHPETAQTMVALGEKLTLAGKSAEADPLLREAVAFFRRAQNSGAADAKWFSIALSALGLAQVARGEAATGEHVLLESLKVGEGLTGSDRAFIPVVLNNLSILKGEQGNIPAAINYLERALEEYRRTPGDARYYTAITLTNLGYWEILKPDYTKAESLLRESIALFRATVGEENQKALITMIHLANTLCQRGDYREAREMIDHVIGLQLRIMAPDHVDFARSGIVLGNILTRTGDPIAGETHLRKALELRQRSFAPGHWRIAEAQTALGDCLAEQKRFPEAEALLLASDSILTKQFGAGDPRTGESRRSLGRLYEAWAKPE